MEHTNSKVIEVRNLKKWFPFSRRLLSSLFRREEYKFLRAVDGVSFAIGRGEALGMAGESGCGKTTTARILTRLYEPTEGDVLFEGVNIAQLKGTDLKHFHRSVQMIFQDPYESLNPRYRTEQIIGEPLIIHGFRDPQDRLARIFEALHIAGLRPPEDFIECYPHEMSGGQRQRVSIARALVLKPKVLVADEPVSMLDVSIRAGLLSLLQNMTQEMNLAAIYISHDLSVIRHFCDRVAIMYLGRIVEIGPTERVIAEPRHPYTQKLLEAVPIPDPEYHRLSPEIIGEIPSPVDVPTGCRFHPRCREAMGICSQESPATIEVEAGHFVECHLY